MDINTKASLSTVSRSESKFGIILEGRGNIRLPGEPQEKTYSYTVTTNNS